MRVCVAFTSETYACVLMGREREKGETHFYSSTGLKWEYKPSCRRLQKRPSVTLQLEATLDKKGAANATTTSSEKMAIFKMPYISVLTENRGHICVLKK